MQVPKTDAVKRGHRLGDVGYSGMAEFAHVHFEVRKNGKVLDPFTGRAQSTAPVKSAACKAAALWMPEVLAAFPYKAGENSSMPCLQRRADRATA